MRINKIEQARPCLFSLVYTLLWLPHLYGFIATGGDNVPAVGRPGDAIHIIGMAVVGVGGSCGISGIPDLDSIIIRTGGDALAIGGPGQRDNIIRMPFIGHHVRSCSSIPDLDRVVVSAGGDALAVGGPGGDIYASGMASIGVDGFSC